MRNYSTNEITFALKSIKYSENFSENKHNTNPSQNHNKKLLQTYVICPKAITS